MKKIIFMLIGIIVIGMLSGCTMKKEVSEKELSLDVNKDIVRFHVLANSDSEEDQALKLKVRDKIIEWLQPKLAKCTSVEKAKEILIANKEGVEEISRTVIERNGYDYNVQAVFTHENFPEKMYGDYVFPQGDYDAYKILIGNAKGKNWWCVMFPPLCFVDSTKNVVSNEKCAENLKDKVVNERKPKYKFKIVESFKDLLAKWS